MQEVQVVSWCDWHLKRDGVKVPARNDERTKLGVDDMVADTDLCLECEGLLAAPLRELLKAIGSRTERPEPKKELPDGSRAPVMSQCPECMIWMDIRSRTNHVEVKHPELKPGEMDWRYGEDVEQVWSCTCGVTFPAAKGRDMHVRHVKNKDNGICSIPREDMPMPAKRPA